MAVWRAACEDENDLDSLSIGVKSSHIFFENSVLRVVEALENEIA